MKNPLIVRLRTGTARIAVALVLGSSLSGCFFEEEPEPVKTTQPSSQVSEAPESTPEPAGPKIFYRSDFESFQKEFNDELADLKINDRAKARNVIMGMAQIIAYKGKTEDNFDYSSGTVSVNHLEDIDVDSDYFYRDFYERISDRFDNGVTFDSIIKLGAGHRRNIVTAHQNAIKSSIAEIDKKMAIIDDKQSQISSAMGQVGVVLPQVSTRAGDIHLNMSVINSSDVPIKGMIMETTTVNRALNGLPQAVKIIFDRTVLPGERRVLKNKKIGSYRGEEDLVEVPIIATVTSVVTETGASITGKEYAPARELLEDLKRAYQETSNNISSRIQEAESDFREKID